MFTQYITGGNSQISCILVESKAIFCLEKNLKCPFNILVEFFLPFSVSSTPFDFLIKSVVFRLSSSFLTEILTAG